MIKVGVYSLKRILYEGLALSINLKTENGEITVLKNHRPLISVLKKGMIKITDEHQKTHYFPINGGFLEVRLNDAKLIVEE